MTVYKILQHNVRSLRANKDEIETYLREKNIDITIWSETWTKINEKYTITGYKLQLSSNISGYRGVGIAVRSNIKHKKIELDFDLSEIEVICIKLEPQEIYIMSIYVPEVSNNVLKADFERLIQFCRGKRIIIGGDFNSHSYLWHSSKEDARGEMVAELFLEEQFIFLNNGKRTKKNGLNSNLNSVIDLTLCAADMFTRIDEWDVDDECLGSDHYCITFEVKIDNIEKKSTRKKKIINTKRVIECINKINFQNESISEFQEKTAKILKQETKVIDTTESSKYWWNSQIKEAIDNKREAIRIFNSNSSSENMIELNKCVAIVKRLIKKAKKEKREELLDTINPLTPMRKVWSISSMLSQKKKKIDYNLILESKERAIEFFEKNYGENDDIREYLENRDESVLLDLETFNEIIKGKRRSAAGSDGITYKMLEEISVEKKRMIVEGLNKIWREGKIDGKLKEVIIYPIPKPGKSPYELEGYRGISLLQIFTKIINTEAKKKLTNFMEENKLMPELSFGFRKGKSTMDCLIMMTNIIKRERRRKNKVAALFLDCSSAFDTVDPDILLEIMEEMQIPKKLRNWFYNNMINRRLVIRTAEGEVSKTISMGVPQGDVPSPDLFNVYTAMVHSLSDENCVLLQFADDKVMICVARNDEELERVMVGKLEELMRILELLKIKVNASKTKIIFFNKRVATNPNIKIENVPVEAVRVHKFLGKHIDNNLTFGVEANEMKVQIKKRLNLFQMLGGSFKKTHPKTLKNLYNGLIGGYINYGACIHAAASKTNLKKVEVLINACLRKVCGLTKSTPLNSMYMIAGEMPWNLKNKLIALKKILLLKFKKSIVYEEMVESLEQEISQINQGNSEDTQRNKYSYLEMVLLEYWQIVRRGVVLEERITDGRGNAMDIDLEVVERVSRKKDRSNLVLKLLANERIGSYVQKLKLYTDATIIDGVAGIAYFMNEFEYNGAKRIESRISIKTAELNAIKLALEIANEGSLKNLLICTDSLTSCKLLKKAQTEKTVEPILNRILRLAKDLEVTLLWIPSHCGVIGNEKVDALAKEVVIQNGNSYEREILSYSDICKVVEEGIMREWQEWHNQRIVEGKGLKMNEFFKDVSRTVWFEKYKSLNGIEIRYLNRLITGHDYSPFYLKLWKISETNICETCSEINNANHIILKCKKFERQRAELNFLSKYEKVQEIITKECEENLKKIVKFIIDNEITI